MSFIKKKIFAISLLISTMFLLCGYTIRGSSMVELEVWEDYDKSFSTFNTIKLDGEYITLPCEVKVLNKLGFDFKVNEEIDPYSMDNFNYMYNKNGDRISVDLINLNDMRATFNDCVIVEISYDEQDGSTLRFDYNGITLGSTIDECEAVLGQAMYVSTVYDGVYTATFKSPKNERTAMLSFYKDNKLIDFSIECDRPLDVGVNGYSPAKKFANDPDYSNSGNYSRNSSNDSPSEGFALAVVIIAVLTVFVFPVVAIIFVVWLILRHRKRVREAEYENKVREAREVRRVLQTPITDESMGVEDDELKNKWLGKS